RGQSNRFKQRCYPRKEPCHEDPSSFKSRPRPSEAVHAQRGWPKQVDFCQIPEFIKCLQVASDSSRPTREGSDQARSTPVEQKQIDCGHAPEDKNSFHDCECSEILGKC